MGGENWQVIEFAGSALSGSARNFVVHSWMRSMPGILKLKFADDSFDSRWHEIVQTLVDQCRIRLAVNPKNQNQIFGWLVYHKNLRVIHFAYVKAAFRKMGVFRDLWNPLDLRYTTMKVSGDLEYAPELVAASMVDFQR